MNIQATNNSGKLGASSVSQIVPHTTAAPPMMYGTRRPIGDRVRSLARPTDGCTAAATNNPPIPSIAKYVFFNPSGARVSTITGNTTVSIAKMNPVTPKLNALSRISAKLLQLSSAEIRDITAIIQHRQTRNAQIQPAR